MEQSNKHIGELSLREMMENLRSPDGRRVPESQIHGSPAFIAISLNDEKSRRQECEKTILQLQSEISVLKQDRAVAEDALQRKDSFLLEAQETWNKQIADWNKKLASSKSDNDHLNSMVSKLKEQLEASLNEGKTAASELLDVRQQHDDTVRHLQEENSKLKEKNDQYEIRLREITNQFDVSRKEAKRIERSLDDSERENRRLKNLNEDLKKEKGKIEAEIHLYQERLEKNQIQWKEHCESRVQETMRNAENLAEQKLEVWRNDVETKLQSMVSSLNYQLGILKSKNLEEITKHQAEMQTMKECNDQLVQQLKQKKKEQEEMKRDMMRLVEAQWNAVHRIQPTSGAGSSASSPVASEDLDLLPNAKEKQRSDPPKSTKAINEHRNPGSRRKV